MSIVQWLVLILIVIAVVGAYLYMRRQAAGDPWRGMDEPDESLDDMPMGDSYVVGVRTLKNETPADRKAAAAARADRSTTEADESAVELDRTRSVRPQPTAVHRRPAPEEPVPEPLLRRSALERANENRARAEADRAEKLAEQTHSTPPRPRATKSQVRSSEIEAPRGVSAPEPADGSDLWTRNAAEHAPKPRSAASGGIRADMVAPQPTPDSQVFILYVAAPNGQHYSGEALHDALAGCDLQFGLNDLYHRVTEKNGVTESVFSVANMVKPGTLHPDDAHALESPGLSMFLLVPGPIEGRAAMHDMMETAHAITTRLGGSVLDDKRVRLKAQTAQFMLDQIAEIDRRARLAQRR